MLIQVKPDKYLSKVVELLKGGARQVLALVSPGRKSSVAIIYGSMAISRILLAFG